MKYFLSAAVYLLVAGAFALAGCGNTVQKETRTVPPAFEEPQYARGTISGETIVLWGDPSDLGRPYLKKALKRYEQSTGNTIQLKMLPRQELQLRAAEAFAAEDQERPDVLLHYGGRNIAPYHPDENFYDFTDAPWVDDLTGTAINQTIYNGKVIGLPHWEASISGMLYNKEILQRYGLQVPRTQAEFLSVCQRLQEHGVTPVYLPYQEITMLLYQFPMDSVVQDSQTLADLDSGALSYAQMPEMQTIVKWYKTMSDRGYFGRSYTEHNWKGMNPAMMSGEYAMMICWDTWLYTDFDGDAAKFGLMPAFMGVPEGGTFEGPNLALLIVNKKSPRLQAALEFITFLADPYNYNVAFEGIFTAPVFKNQVGSIATPQYVEAERLIDKRFCDSTAWLRIQGFSQFDALYIQRYMREQNYTALECLRDMDNARKARITQ